MSLPKAWRDRNDNQRDLLLSLALDGPSTNAELFERVGGMSGHRSKASTSRGLHALRDKGLVDSEPADGSSVRWELTGDGAALVDSFRAAVC